MRRAFARVDVNLLFTIPISRSLPPVTLKTIRAVFDLRTYQRFEPIWIARAPVRLRTTRSRRAHAHPAQPETAAGGECEQRLVLGVAPGLAPERAPEARRRVGHPHAARVAQAEPVDALAGLLAPDLVGAQVRIAKSGQAHAVELPSAQASGRVIAALAGRERLPQCGSAARERHVGGLAAGHEHLTLGQHRPTERLARQ